MYEYVLFTQLLTQPRNLIRAQCALEKLSRNNHYTTPVLAACIIVVVSFQPQLECCGMQGGGDRVTKS